MSWLFRFISASDANSHPHIPDDRLAAMNIAAFHPSGERLAASTPDGSKLAVGRYDGSAVIYDLRNGKGVALK